MKTPFGRNNTKKILISATDQSTETNRIKVEHLLLQEVHIRSKYLVVGSAQLGDNLITESDQESTSIDIWLHGEWDFLFGSMKSGNKMSVYIGQKMDDKIAKSPSRAIWILFPQVTSTKMINCKIFNLIIRVSPCHGKMKNETGNLVKNLRYNTI